MSLSVLVQNICQVTTVACKHNQIKYEILQTSNEYNIITYINTFDDFHVCCSARILNFSIFELFLLRPDTSLSR